MPFNPKLNLLERLSCQLEQLKYHYPGDLWPFFKKWQADLAQEAEKIAQAEKRMNQYVQPLLDLYKQTDEGIPGESNGD